MSKRQLVLLFIGGLVPWTVGNGLMCLLPIYALELGASESISGYYLAFSFMGLSGGTMFAGWLADKFQRRKLLLIVSAAVLIPSLYFMGEARSIWHLAAATAAAWFSAGMAISVTTILAGLFAGKKERGKVLGIIAMTNGVGSVVGGLVVGPMVDRWGYTAMFLALSLFSALLLVIGFTVKDKKVESATENRSAGATIATAKTGFSKAFYILLLAQFTAVIINSIASMGRSLSMNSLEFTATAITSTVVIGGLVSIPFPFILGWLSDRLGRKRMMIICYLGYSLCISAIAVSTSLWHFYVAIILVKVGMASISVGSAFVADLVEPKALGKGVSLFQTAGWVAFASGFIATGNAFESFGIAASSIGSSVLPLISIILIMSIRVAGKKKQKALAQELVLE